MAQLVADLMLIHVMSLSDPYLLPDIRPEEDLRLQVEMLLNRGKHEVAEGFTYRRARTRRTRRTTTRRRRTLRVIYSC